jgi:hypothetical protein
MVRPEEGWAGLGESVEKNIFCACVGIWTGIGGRGVSVGWWAAD